ncbi:MAG: helix-turn-helix domain-containing protein [Bacteroidales bacterium]|nr:helix-turn-helix domain-containing protein [Bacteroidales bacterium]MCQ2608066.1 helix-turn-helix domain-containing protein [Bacteroidales bacterium]MCQ2959024.1 helix-turn-helix domain-containing protein [Bacteroidales bacterium]
MAKMKLTNFDDLLDEFYGKVGTPHRDEFEKNVDEALHAYRIGEAIKIARKRENLTQEELGERMGIHKAQVSKIESGKNMTFSTIEKAFKALGAKTATIDFGSFGKVALW